MTEPLVAEAKLRGELARWGRSLFERGFTVGSSGNMSVRLAEGFLFRPTNSCLDFLGPERLAKLDRQGQHVEGDAPTKELPMHIVIYESPPVCQRRGASAFDVSTARSCLDDVDPEDAVPPIAPYHGDARRPRPGPAVCQAGLAGHRTADPRGPGNTLNTEGGAWLAGYQ